MKISVIIPTYKPKAYLYDCLRSLCQQTLSPQEWEVLLVLNGEHDPYRSNIETYIAEQMQGINIHLLYSEIPGVSNARNLGLDQACGEYITFIDDDDLISPSYLEELLAISSPAIVGLSNSIAFDEQSAHIPSPFEQEYQRCHDKGLQPFYSPKKLFSVVYLKLIHKDIIANRRFDVRFANAEDSLYMFLISDRMNQVAFTSENAIYFRRIRSNGAHITKSSYKHIQNIISSMAEYTHIFMKGQYSAYFFFTRLLATMHRIFSQK